VKDLLTAVLGSGALTFTFADVNGAGEGVGAGGGVLSPFCVGAGTTKRYTAKIATATVSPPNHIHAPRDMSSVYQTTPGALSRHFC